MPDETQYPKWQAGQSFMSHMREVNAYLTSRGEPPYDLSNPRRLFMTMNFGTADGVPVRTESE